MTASPRRAAERAISFTITQGPGSDKTIECLRYGVESDSKTNSHAAPALIFTHGAGGSLTSDAIANFSQGFSEPLDGTKHGSASSKPVVCFKGNMNLKSRVSMFHSVIQHCSSNASAAAGLELSLGGRSMGARAAVMALSQLQSSDSDVEIQRLILASYPLHTTKKSGEEDVRDAILLDLPATTDVLFVSGDKDEMCSLPRLHSVRRKMKARSWLCVIEGADHGMNVTPKRGTESVGIETGRIARDWLELHDASETECEVRWDGDEERAVRGEWKAGSVVTKKADDHVGAKNGSNGKKQTQNTVKELQAVTNGGKKTSRSGDDVDAAKSSARTKGQSGSKAKTGSRGKAMKEQQAASNPRTQLPRRSKRLSEPVSAVGGTDTDDTGNKEVAQHPPSKKQRRKKG